MRQATVVSSPVGRAEHQHGVAPLVVLKFFQQAKLRLLLHGFVRRAVLAHPEGIMRPDELDGRFHEGGHAEYRLHVVREHEERAASGDNPTVQAHAHAQGSHGQLGHACLKERAREVAPREGFGLLEETVRLVRIGEVGTGHNHVAHLPCQLPQHGGRSRAGSLVGLLRDGIPIHPGSLAGKVSFQFSHLPDEPAPKPPWRRVFPP